MGEHEQGSLLQIAAAASAGAALVHAAAAGAHGDHNSVQILFVACAALQLAWAAAVFVAPRPPLVFAGVLLNVGAVAAWVTQRTVGLPVVDALREPEDVGLQDSLAALLGALAALGAAAWLLPAIQRRTLPRGWAATGAVFALVLAVPAMAADHDAGGGHSHAAVGDDAAGGHAHGAEAEAATDGHGDHAATPAAVASKDRCDVGFNTAEFNEETTLVEEPPSHGDHAVDFTVAEWADEFAPESLGIEPAALTQWIEGDQYRTRDVMAGDLTPSLEPDPWVPMTDPAQCAALASELDQARAAAARYPTLADALADGYVSGSLYAPGQGAHFSKFDNIVDEGFNPAEPELLMFDGPEPDAKLLGVMYYLIDSDGLPPEVGFTGTSDVWHVHQSLCRDAATNVAVSWRECDEGRANVTDESYGHMLHAWIVPGCESDWGVFSPANPRLPYLPTAGAPFSADFTLASGCDSGKTVADPLTFDGSGGGAVIK